MDEFITWLFNSKEWLFSGAGVAVIAAVGGYFYKQRQSSSSQTIRSGSNSTNIQAGQDVNIGSKVKGRNVE